MINLRGACGKKPSRAEFVQQDIEDLRRLGYAQQLYREMGGFSKEVGLGDGLVEHDRVSHHRRGHQCRGCHRYHRTGGNKNVNARHTLNRQ